jgi:hypothetical protein
MFNIINAHTDCDTLQLNIESIENWCKNNKLALNINKCKVMTFSRKANPNLVQLGRRWSVVRTL